MRARSRWPTSRVRAFRLRHPGTTLGYRLAPEGGGREIAYVTDNELDGRRHLPGSARTGETDWSSFWRDGHADPRRDVPRGDHPGPCAAGATPRPRQAVDLAAEAGCRRLVLFHHEPEHDDDALDRLLDDTRAYARRVDGEARGRGRRRGNGAVRCEATAVLHRARGRLGCRGSSRASSPTSVSPCCRSRTPAPTGRTRKSSKAWSSALATMLASCARPSPGVDVPDQARQNEALKAAGVVARRSGWMRRPRRRWRRRWAHGSPSPAASPTSTASSGSTPAWWMPRRGQILEVVSNNDPKLQDRAELSAHHPAAGGADHQGRQACHPPHQPARRPSPPMRSPTTAADCCTRSRGDRAKALDYYRRARDRLSRLSRKRRPVSAAWVGLRSSRQREQPSRRRSDPEVYRQGQGDDRPVDLIESRQEPAARTRSTRVRRGCTRRRG